MENRDDQHCEYSHEAESEKSAVALNSVLAATALTLMKIVVGVLTGSLGILAEAAHSGLDLVAAFVTWVAVRIGGKPADRKHPYGHGKVENLSAMFETVLLLVTCAWIINEVIHRLTMANPPKIEISFWAFAVMIISIVVDISRSRMLYTAAKKHHSQALEADALHFSTDIYSSLVVLVGLVCVKITEYFPSLQWLHVADSVAALFVALIVIGISLRLGIRTVEALLDTSPVGADVDIIGVIEQVPGVIDCHKMRVREAGPKLFVDAHVTMDGQMPLLTVHALMDEIETKVREKFPNVDITIHPEPTKADETSASE